MSTAKLPPGKGWETIAEIREKTGMSDHLARRGLKALAEQGKVETFRGSRECAGALKIEVWYRRK